jgi:hypothetical protein|nr:MAG TPA: hypothetical protein [Caudoviricetes sp.]
MNFELLKDPTTFIQSTNLMIPLAVAYDYLMDKIESDKDLFKKLNFKLAKEYNLTVDYANNGDRKYIVFNVYKGSNLRVSFSTIDKRFVKAYMLDGDNVYMPIDYSIFSQSMMYSVFVTEFIKAHGIYDTDKEFKSFYKDALYYSIGVDEGNIFAGITAFFLPSDDEGIVYDAKGLFEDIKWLTNNREKLEKITGEDGYSSALKSIDAESFTLKYPYGQELPNVVIFYKEVENLVLVYMENHVDSSFVFAIKYDANRDKYLVNYNEIYNVLMYENNIPPTNISDSYLKNIFFVKIMNDVKLIYNMIRVREFVNSVIPEDIMRDAFAKSKLSTDAVSQAEKTTKLFTDMSMELSNLMKSTENITDKPLGMAYPTASTVIIRLMDIMDEKYPELAKQLPMKVAFEFCKSLVEKFTNIDTSIASFEKYERFIREDLGTQSIGIYILSVISETKEAMWNSFIYQRLLEGSIGDINTKFDTNHFLYDIFKRIGIELFVNNNPDPDIKADIDFLDKIISFSISEVEEEHAQRLLNDTYESKLKEWIEFQNDTSDLEALYNEKYGLEVVHLRNYMNIAAMHKIISVSYDDIMATSIVISPIEYSLIILQTAMEFYISEEIIMDLLNKCPKLKEEFNGRPMDFARKVIEDILHKVEEELK